MKYISILNPYKLRLRRQTISLANRLNQIIDEQKISKCEFAKRVGISENYVYTLTGESNKITTLSPMLAKVIAMEFGYDAEWILHGEKE